MGCGMQQTRMGTKAEASTARRKSVSNSFHQIACKNNAFPRAKLGTAYRNWPRQFGGATSRAQHRCAALGAATAPHMWQRPSTTSAPLAGEGVVVVRVADHIIGMQLGDLFRRVTQQPTQHLLVV